MGCAGLRISGVDGACRWWQASGLLSVCMRVSVGTEDSLKLNWRCEELGNRTNMK